VDPSAIERAITERTLLVSLMLANNEIGTLQPIEEVGAITRARGVLLHCDASQGLGRVPFDVERMNVDLASLSGHKLYGPKGAGALYVRGKNPRVRLMPEIEGGGHERGLRSGTLNVPATVGLGAACRLMADVGPKEAQRIGSLRDRLHRLIIDDIEGVVLNGPEDGRLPENLNLSFTGVDSAALIGALKADLAVSSGAACSSASLELSHVIRVIAGDARARSSLRFGLGRTTTSEEVEYAAARVIEAVRSLRG
jgi:cysteine desulfurase